MLFHKEKNIVVLATKFSTAANLVKKVKSMMKTKPGLSQIATDLKKITQIEADELSAPFVQITKLNPELTKTEEILKNIIEAKKTLAATPDPGPAVGGAAPATAPASKPVILKIDGKEFARFVINSVNTGDASMTLK